MAETRVQEGKAAGAVEQPSPGKSLPRIEVIADFCKGCEICVVMCPRNVLEMRADPSRWVGSVVVVVRPEACTRCMLCEVHCPDFAIKVF
jgi:2-oxoglutarate ferredoxin oxidoreductase subunit delta